MAISNYIADGEQRSIIESTSITGQPGRVVLNPDGTNIGQFSTTSLPGSFQKVLAEYPGTVIDFYDTFEDGSMHGWNYHNQSNLAVKRGSPTLSHFSKRGFSLSLRTGNTPAAQTVARKGEGTLNLPYNAKKLILLYEFAWHSWWLHGFYRGAMCMDTQIGLGNRHFYKIGYQRSANGSTDDNQWQYDSACSDTPTWVTLTGGQLTSAWNEPYKPTFGFGGLVVDLENNRYHKMYYNNTSINMTSLPVGSGAALTEYPDAVNLYLYNENRNAGTTNTSELMFDSILFAYTL